MDTEELIGKIRMLLAGAWRRRWIGLAMACLLALTGAVGIVMMKDRYEASARIYVDTQTVLKPLMAGLAFQPDIDQQVRMLARTLISRPNIERLMALPDVDMEARNSREQERAINRLMEGIKVAPSGTGNLYTITYRDTDPRRAQSIVSNLVQLFVESSIGSKKKDSEEASRFIDAQIAEYEGKLVEAENRLKEFKLRNFGVSGVSNQDYFSRISALADEVSRLRVELTAAEQSRDALKKELLAEEPQLPPGASLSGAPIALSETEARLEAQRRQLDELLRRYTDQHPDVVAARRTIAQLELQKRQEAADRAAGGAKGAATNPVFQRIRMALADAEANVASLRTRLGAQQARLDQIRSTASRVPQVEAELAQLNRDYDIIRKNYEALVARREAASLGVKIDQSSNLADFRLVEPARVSQTPVFPTRKILAAAIVLVSLGCGAAASLALAWFTPSLNSEKSLRQLTGRPVLGSVSMVLSPELKRKERRAHFRFAGALGAFLTANVTWLAWLVLSPTRL